MFITKIWDNDIPYIFFTKMPYTWDTTQLITSNINNLKIGFYELNLMLKMLWKIEKKRIFPRISRSNKHNLLLYFLIFSISKFIQMLIIYQKVFSKTHSMSSIVPKHVSKKTRKNTNASINADFWILPSLSCQILCIYFFRMSETSSLLWTKETFSRKYSKSVFSKLCKK